MEAVDPLVVELIESLATTPAFVANEQSVVLASNSIARAVTPTFTVGTNLARATFVDPVARAVLPRWQDASDHMVARLKETIGAGSDARRDLEELVAELSSRSAEFSDAWASEGTELEYVVALAIDHPQVGLIDITYRSLQLPAGGQTLVLGHVEPGSASEARLFQLAAGPRDGG